MAQPTELKRAEDNGNVVSSALGLADKGIVKVRLIADNEQSIIIEADYQNLDDEKYQIKGAILNKQKEAVDEVEVVTKELPKNKGTVELQFQFKATGTYTTNFFETGFLQLSVSKAGGILGNLEIGGQNIFASNYLYVLDKKWRIGGSESTVIEVKLTPYKSASSIRQ